MKTLGIIPARYSSTRLPGKPLAMINGKSMIQRVYERAIQWVDEVVVATDDQRIVEAVNSFGGKVTLTGDHHQTGTNRCLEAYEQLGFSESDFDVVINIQGDEPLLAENHIKQLISCFEDPNTTMGTLVHPIHDAEELKSKSDIFVVINKDQYALYFSRQVIPQVRGVEFHDWVNHHTYYKHIGLYAFKPHALKEFANLSPTTLEKAESLEQLRWLENGNQIKVAITHEKAIAVDTPEDLEKAIKLVQEEEA